MKVIHIESGLGNQMLSYCELLSMRKVHPNETFYIETLTYDIEEANSVICQWNGYELYDIFKIEEKNIKEYFSEEQWNSILETVRLSEFWNKQWNWPVYITDAFKKQGLILHNLRGDFEKNNYNYEKSLKGRIRKNNVYKKIQKTCIHTNLRTLLQKIKKYKYSDVDYLFYKGEENVIAGQKLSFMYLNNHIEIIEDEIRRIFSFPPFTDTKNKQFSDYLKNVNGIAIHARRGDLLALNGRYYTGGYFRRAVNYIKHHVNNPVFCFFCDPGSIEWCKCNEKMFGLDFGKDKVEFVDWNSGKDSFRDMQLMSYCKHNIITISSFGWWGAFLNTNPNKITISPENKINTTHHF